MSTQLIRAAVDEAGSQAKFASLIKRSQQHVSFLLSGKYKPSAEDAVAIEAATSGKIPRWKLRPDLWSRPSANKQTEAA